MDRREGGLTNNEDDSSGEVRSLGVERRLDEPGVAVSPPGRSLGLAIWGMAACALVGIAALLAFITIRWPAGSGRYVMAILIGSVVGFTACAATAVLSAARDTYPRRGSQDDRLP